jgi:hypothetical protein
LIPLIHWFLDTPPSFGNLNRLQKLFVGLAIMMVVTSPLAFGVANTDVAILAEKVKADKTLLVCINMALTNEKPGFLALVRCGSKRTSHGQLRVWEGSELLWSLEGLWPVFPHTPLSSCL